MCGLVGMIGDLTFKQKDAFDEMLIVDSLRGVHSVGIASVDSTGCDAWARSTAAPVDALQTKTFEEVKKGSLKLLMGHNRHATQGKINYTNAHPFEHGEIVGMHNGTLRNWRSVLDDARDFDVDSDCLMWNIALKGIEKTVENLDGAWALTWINVKKNTFHMLRNGERPLFYCQTADKKSMIYASEPWMITAIMGRNNISLLANGMSQLKENTLVTMEIPRGLNAGLGKPSLSGVKSGFVKPVTYNRNTNMNSHGKGARGGVQNKNTTSGQNSNQPVKPVGNLVPQVNAKGVQSSNASGFPSIQRRQEFSEADKARNAGMAKAAKMSAAYRGLQGKTVQFYALSFSARSDVVGDANCVVKGLLVSDPEIDVHMYCNAQQAEDYIQHKGAVDARICSVSTAYYTASNQKANKGYLIADRRTATVVKDPKESTSNVIILPDAGKRDMSQTEFDKKTKGGCSNCSCNLYVPSDAVWYGDEPLCAQCDLDIQQGTQTGSIH